jgi:hypothetical protein
MLRVVNLEEIQGVLLEVPALVDRLSRHDPDYGQHVHRWLAEVERILGNNRLSLAGNIASLRALLIGAEAGVFPTQYQPQKPQPRRRIIEAIASDCLRQASDLLSQSVAADENRIREAEQLMRQIVALADHKGLVPDPSQVTDWTGYLKTVWRAIEQDADLQNGKVRMLGLVGPNDTLLLLDRTITSDLMSQ